MGPSHIRNVAWTVAPANTRTGAIVGADRKPPGTRTTASGQQVQTVTRFSARRAHRPSRTDSASGSAEVTTAETPKVQEMDESFRGESAYPFSSDNPELAFWDEDARRLHPRCRRDSSLWV